jgi:GTP-binding protein
MARAAPEVKVLESDFVISAAVLAGAPLPEHPEICFLGRSNVGKSSAINSLLGRRKLARVSNTPGRTRLLNFFKARLDVDGTREWLSLCDLPGYGYAKAPREEVESWQKMIEGYLANRPRLCGAIVLVDSRHEPSDLDKALLAWLADKGRSFRVVATKADKIGRNQLGASLTTIERQLKLPARSVIAYSSETGAGKEELWAAIVKLARDAG